ncbi:hypothetical protein BJY59DRAFT_279860 [Rhodotorula toruloides]
MSSHGRAAVVYFERDRPAQGGSRPRPSPRPACLLGMASASFMPPPAPRLIAPRGAVRSTTACRPCIVLISSLSTLPSLAGLSGHAERAACQTRRLLGLTDLTHARSPAQQRPLPPPPRLLPSEGPTLSSSRLGKYSSALKTPTQCSRTRCTFSLGRSVSS